MYSVGEIIVYGGEGVCKIDNIAPANIPGADKNKLYYYLNPYGRNGQVMTPIDTKVLLRPALTKNEAMELIGQFSKLEPEEVEGNNIRIMKEFYHSVVSSYDCIRTAKLIRMTTKKKKAALEKGKKVSQMDERYLKRAEEQLYGELAIALDIDINDVVAFIRKYCANWPEE